MSANKGSFFFFSPNPYAFYSCLYVLHFKIVFMPVLKNYNLFHIPNPGGIIQNQKRKPHGGPGLPYTTAGRAGEHPALYTGQMPS